MDPIPEFWPPEPPPTTDAPIFPLPGLFLFPGQLLPLLVFEPRYRQMIEDSLDGPGRLVIGTLCDEPAGDEPPAFLPVAGLGEIMRHEKLPDGRFKIWVYGRVRVLVEELPSERLYRRVRCAPLLEREPGPSAAQALDESLRDAIGARTRSEIDLPKDLSTAQLTDILAQFVAMPQADMARIFAEPDVASRAREVLAAHARFPA
jgi:Lon protease-like protein